MSTKHVPKGCKPVYSASPSPAPKPRIVAEMQDTVIDRDDLPRGYGSQLAGWQGGS